MNKIQIIIVIIFCIASFVSGNNKNIHISHDFSSTVEENLISTPKDSNYNNNLF